MRRCLRLAPSLVPVKSGYASSRGGDFLLIGEQSRDDPKIMPQHAPSHSQVAVLEAAAAQSAALALLEDRDAGLGRSPPALQPGEALFAESSLQFPRIAGADRVVDVALRELFGALTGAKAAVRTGRCDRGRQVKANCWRAACRRTLACSKPSTAKSKAIDSRCESRNNVSSVSSCCRNNA